jgi:hypothetical protein
MEFADLGPMRLGHDHAHEIVRLRVGGRETHGVARVQLGFGQRALAEQQRGERLRRRQIIGIEPDDPGEQGSRRRHLVLGAAQLIRHPQRLEMARKPLQQIDQEPRGLGGVARIERGHARGRARAFPAGPPAGCSNRTRNSGRCAIRCRRRRAMTDRRQPGGAAGLQA